MLDEIEWLSLEARSEKSSLAFFYKIYSRAVSLEKDKYLSPAPNSLPSSVVSSKTSDMRGSRKFS